MAFQVAIHLLLLDGRPAAMPAQIGLIIPLPQGILVRCELSVIGCGFQKARASHWSVAPLRSMQSS
jgi:hypothetical protein